MTEDLGGGISLRDVLESMPDGLIVASEDQGIRFANIRAMELFGYARHEMTGMSIHELLPSRLRERHRQHKRRYLENPHVRSMGTATNLVGLRKDGSEFTAEVSLSPFASEHGVLVIAAVRDATEKKALIHSLRASRERLTAVIASMSDGLVAAESGGRITDLNPEAERLLGIRSVDAVGRSLDEIVRLRDPRTLRDVEVPLDFSQPTVQMIASLDEVILLRASGEPSFVSLSVAPVQRPLSRGQGAVLVLRDVSERRELRKRAQVSEHLASLGALAAGIGHEINNPLTYAMGNADLMRRHLEQLTARLEVAFEGTPDSVAEPPRRMLRCIDDLTDALERIELIVRDLRQFSRTESLEEASCDLGKVLRSAVRICRSDLLQRSRIEADVDGDLLVCGSAARLGQVFINLLINAAHALPEPRRSDSLIRIDARVDQGSRAVVEIRDNGSGIDPQHLDRIFDPFFTTKPEGEGTGLGLSICDRIVAELGGKLDLRSQLGEGTIVTIQLPLAPAGRLDEATDRKCSSPALPHR